MSMCTANYLRSPCEVIREINDEFQGDTKRDEKIRKLCAEAEAMTKRMSIELTKYDDKYYKTWWEKVVDFNNNLIRRKSPEYKFHKI